MTPSSPPSYTFLEPTPSPLLNTLTSAPTPPPTTHETTQPNNTTIPNAEPNTTYTSTPQGPTLTEPQSTLPTSIAHNHTSGPSTLAHPTSPLPPPIFELSNPQTLSRYKARLVANGSSQQLGVDFDETFILVVKPATVRMVLRLTVSRKWSIHQLDVKNAFLNGDISEIVYMHQPPGFVDNRQGSQVAYLLIYVDDIILITSCPALLPQNIGSLNNEFNMTDLGALNYFLGIYVDRTPTESKLDLEVQQICLYMHDLREPHFAALKRILRYVRGTVDFGL
ncbi:ribonuclease H-like domain-containing protein [Tanacetum coccineum]|uniref:Ribonuclease H-like domain-containing protein n=1 Tax=Tanacetum coccineum TaxID=301880 RepID=A0ABQ5FLU5_9ASTR